MDTKNTVFTVRQVSGNQLLLQMIKTKHSSILPLLFVSIILTVISCKKQAKDQVPPGPEIIRKFQFELFTDQDFSDNSDSISFTLFIQHPGDQPLWDTVLSPMKIKEIPKLPNKLVIQKMVTGDNSLLKAGFRYSIKDIGSSSWLDSSSAGTNFKIVAFNFR